MVRVRVRVRVRVWVRVRLRVRVRDVIRRFRALSCLHSAQPSAFATLSYADALGLSP